MTSLDPSQKLAVEAVHHEIVDEKAGPQAITGDVQLLNAEGEVRRIPIPSADPNDPLNFSKWRKLGILVCCCWFSIFSLVLVGGMGPILSSFFELYAPTGKTPTQIVNLTTYPSLVMACGCFIILPLSMVFGRRPVFLGCSIVLLGSTIGAATSQSFNTHMACRIIQGIAAGSTESVLPLIITDMTFVDERGFFFGVYWGVQNLINTVFLISSSYLVAATSWRWWYGVLAIFCGVGIILGFFLLTETKYERTPTSLNGQVIATDEWGVTHILSDDEARQRFGHLQDATAMDIPPQKSYLQTLSPVSGVAANPVTLAFSAIVKMFKALSSPAVVWAVLVSSIVLGCGIAISLTYSSVLTTKFNWQPASVGNVNIGIFPASLLAMLYAGYVGDKMNIWLARRRGGVHTPEDTLVQLILPFLVGVVGLVVYATTAMWPESHSAWGIIMGWSLFEWAFIVVLIVSTHFGSEAFPSNPGSALVIVVGLKNIISFGCSFGIVPMVTKYSYLEAYMILLAFLIGIFLLGIPVYFINPRWRARISRVK